jgi:para-aminobenzoate synthetase/4-amino-4-deoxychorismate lyase
MSGCMPAASNPDPAVGRESALSPDPAVDRESVISPDPALGVFETLLVVEGLPVELEAHLARLDASLRALFGSGPGEQRARELVLGEAARLSLGRVRITARPLAVRGTEAAGGGFELDAAGREVDPALVLPYAGRAVALRSLTVPGGLGAHKWADRRLLEVATGQGAAGARGTASAEEGSAASPRLALLLDRDGSALEAARANVFAAHEGALTTPPADGRILPGVTRALVIEIARGAGVELREARITRRQLLEADEVLLSGAVRGVEPVGAIDESEIQPGGELTRLVAEGLRHRWLERAETRSARSPSASPRRGPRGR